MAAPTRLQTSGRARVIIPTLLAVLSQYCAKIPAPTVRPFADGVDWVLVEPLQYVIGSSTLTITVPQGFVTDFASIPPALQSFLSPVGRHGRAAIVHDFLYWDQSCSRSQADNLLRLGMIESGVDARRRTVIYEAVHLLGETAWKENAELRRRGMPRVIPRMYLRIPDDAIWPTFRGELFAKGIRAEPIGVRTEPTYCSATEAALAAH